MRIRKNISQEELGFKSGISTNSISAIERGNYNFHIKTLYKIAEALGVEINEILDCKF